EWITLLSRASSNSIFHRDDIIDSSADPAVCYRSCIEFLFLMYETLLTYNGNSTELIGNLATEVPSIKNGGISSDWKTYTFHLRRDVDFPDGTHFDAYVMKYSIDRAILMNIPFGPVWILAQSIRGGSAYMASETNATDVETYLTAEGVEVTDKYTIKFHLEEPHTPFLSTLTFPVGAAVSPKVVIEKIPLEWTNNLTLNNKLVTLNQIFRDPDKQPDWSWVEDNNHAGIIPREIHPGMTIEEEPKRLYGTGPYILENISILGEDDSGPWWFERNDNWWKVKARKIQLPSLRKIIYQIEDNETVRFNRYINNEIDFADQLSRTSYEKIVNFVTGEILIKGNSLHTNDGAFLFLLGFNMFDDDSIYINESAESTYWPYRWERWGHNHPEFGTKATSNPFTAREFRRAFAYAYDYESSVAWWGGLQYRLNGTIPDGIPYHDKSLNNELPVQDLDLAKFLFERIGWLLKSWELTLTLF
ncbi:MAG: ABC transporter substrate-binding protein, partial [Candidatus Kariarchaeaceae archaeon]